MREINYKILLPDQTYATRKSKNVYTHIVAGLEKGKWSAYSYCGSYELALKQYKVISKYTEETVIIQI